MFGDDFLLVSSCPPGPAWIKQMAVVTVIAANLQYISLSHSRFEVGLSN